MPCVNKINLRSKCTEVYIINLLLKACYLCSDVHMRLRDHNSVDHNVEVLITCHLNYFVYAVSSISALQSAASVTKVKCCHADGVQKANIHTLTQATNCTSN